MVRPLLDALVTQERRLSAPAAHPWKGRTCSAWRLGAPHHEAGRGMRPALPRATRTANLERAEQKLRTPASPGTQEGDFATNVLVRRRDDPVYAAVDPGEPSRRLPRSPSPGGNQRVAVAAVEQLRAQLTAS
jgi:hypothetical protein